jgi:hypothetical protein
MKGNIRGERIREVRAEVRVEEVQVEKGGERRKESECKQI